MKILVYGSNGWIGGIFVDILKKIILTLNAVNPE